MEINKKLTSILNLCNELPEELSQYFSKKEISIIWDEGGTSHFSHILIDSNQEISSVATKYKTVSKNIQMISIDPVEDLKEFIVANGKLILTENWLKSSVCHFILDKFFQEFQNASEQVVFSESGNFKIINPFSTGDNLDRLVHQAFQDQVDGLAVKIFFDHFTMYLAGLRTKGKIGYPIEVSYGGLEGIFATQFTMHAQNFNMQDLAISSSKTIDRKLEKNLFNIAFNSTDFFDITYLKEVNKAVITCLWSKDKYQDHGFMVNDFSKNAKIIAPLFKDGENPQQEIIDHTPKIILPQEDKILEKFDGQALLETLAEKISEDISIDQIKEIIKSNRNVEIESVEKISGNLDSQDEIKKVSGNFDEEEEAIKIASDSEIKQSVQKISGMMQEEKTEFRIPGSKKVDQEKFVVKVSSALCEGIEDPNMRMKLQSYQQNKLKEEMQKFAKNLGKDAANLSDEELHQFNQEAIPSVVKATEACQQKMMSFKSQLKQALIEGLTLEYNGADTDELMQSIENGDFNRIKSILKESLKQNLNDKFELQAKGKLNNSEQDSMVRILSASLEIPEDKMKDLVDQQISASIKIPQVEENDSKFEKINLENQSLKKKLLVLMNELKVLKDTKKQIQLIDKGVIESLPQFESMFEESTSVRHTILHGLKDGNDSITQEDARRLSAVLEKEAKMIESLKADELNNKRMIIEMNQKQVLFEQQIEQLNRQIRAKDLVITKTKESFSNLIDKKNNEISNIKDRMAVLNQQINSGEIKAQLNQVKILEHQNLNLNKMVEIYKEKVSELSAQIQKLSQRTDDSESREEDRKNQIITNQLKQQLEAAKKELHFLQEKHTEDASNLITLRNEKMKLEQQLKKALLDANKKEEIQQTNLVDPQVKKLEGQVSVLENQLKEALTKAKDFEFKLQSSQTSKKQDPALDEANKKVAHLESSVKKLTQDLVESRNQQAEMKKESIKFKSEKTGLQNQIEALKKDLEKEKEKSASQKKSGGKAA